MLDMEEDEDVPIILGLPFLVTSKTLIDMQQGKLTLRLDDEEVVFIVFNSLKHHFVFDSCHVINFVDALVSLNSISVQENLIQDNIQKLFTLGEIMLTSEDEWEADIMALEVGKDQGK